MEKQPRVPTSLSVDSIELFSFISVPAQMWRPHPFEKLFWERFQAYQDEPAEIILKELVKLMAGYAAYHRDNNMANLLTAAIDFLDSQKRAQEQGT